MDFCVAELLWWAFGFALAFGAGTSGVFGLSHWLYGVEGGASAATFFLFQLMFCGTSATIVSGAVAERVTFSGYVVITLVISAVVYPLYAHWAWNTAQFGGVPGWLAALGFVDFAGSTVVHSIGGWVSLAAVLVIGPRAGRFLRGVPAIREIGRAHV